LNNNRNINEVTKAKKQYLNHVFDYMERSIAVRFINNVSELATNWENAQYELSAQYQYEGINEHVWDYYLVFWCSFDEESLDNKLRFKIESDRFCCRKYFIFSSNMSTFSKKELIQKLFPLVEVTNPIKIITATSIIEKLEKEAQAIVTPSFFTKEMSDLEATTLLNSFLLRVDSTDG
jgi:hypothetical protein